MSSDSVDFYDVQNAVAGEARERRAAVDELRELVAVREREAHEAILALREHVASLERLIHARTEHLV